MTIKLIITISLMALLFMGCSEPKVETWTIDPKNELVKLCIGDLNLPDDVVLEIRSNDVEIHCINNNHSIKKETYD